MGIFVVGVLWTGWVEDLVLFLVMTMLEYENKMYLNEGFVIAFVFICSTCSIGVESD